jgi:hypothetical protein
VRRVGQFLSYVGLAIGGLLGLSMLVHVQVEGLPWLFAVGMAKLTFAVSIGLIGAGAVIQRIALRAAEPAQLPPPRDS